MGDLRYVVIDFETFFSTEFTLQRLPLVEYIRSPQFKSFGAAVYEPATGKPGRWLNHQQFKSWCAEQDWSTIAMVSHNSAFDGAVLAWRYGYAPARYVDTLGMARAVLGPVLKSFSLDKVGQHLGVGSKLDGGKALMAVKGLRNPPPHLLADLSRYAIEDAYVCWRIFENLSPYFPANEYATLDWTLRCWIEPGLRLNTDVLQRAMEEEEDRRTVLLIRSECSVEQLRSDATFAALLEDLGVVPEMKISKRTGRPAYAFAKTDPFMEGLLEHENPDVVALAEARLGVKTSIVQTRIQTLMDHAAANEGWFSVGLRYAAAHTHRFGGTGYSRRGAANIQNFPREGLLNEAIEAPEGWVVINADSSQIECRLTLWMAGELEALGMLARGEDLYSKFASAVYGRPISKEHDPAERQCGKVSVLSCGYGSGAVTFQNMLRVQGKIKIDDGFAKRVIDTYRSQFPGVPGLWRKLDGALGSLIRGQPPDPDLIPVLEWSPDAYRPGFYTPSGLFIGYPNLRYLDGRKMGYDRVSKATSTDLAFIWGGTLLENIAQNLAREIVVWQLHKIDAELKTVLQVHDSVGCLAPADQADAACQFVYECMSTAPPWAAGFPVACEVGYGRTYAEAKKAKWKPRK